MMRFGLTEKELQFLIQTVVVPLHKTAAQIYVFGSRARGDHQQFSDIELLIVSEFDLGKVIGEIAEHLEVSNFPYKVDIVEDRHLATAYRAGIERDKVLI